MRNIQSAPIQIVKVLVWIIAIGLAQPAFAQQEYVDRGLQAISECRASHPGSSQDDACLGQVVDICLLDHPGIPIIPPDCSQAELLVWDMILNSTYQDLISDMNSRGYGSFVTHIRASQRHWLEQMRLDCELMIMANPQRYDLMPACKAHATMTRVFFLEDFIGADWSAMIRY